MTDVAVRAATVTDTAGVEPLVGDALGTLRGLRGGDGLLARLGVPAEISPAALASALCGDALLGVTCFVAERAGRVVGFCVVVATGEGVDLVGVHTVTPSRRRGVGAALLGAARSFAEAAGNRLEALALPGDQGVKSLLESAGYKARLLRMSAER